MAEDNGSPENTDTTNAIVNEMLERLRELQGSGEFAPIGRKVTAGLGLEGGGALTDDVALALAGEYRTTLETLKDVDPEQLATVGEVAKLQALADDTAARIRRVYYRDFTVMAAPSSRVSAPPIIVDEAATVARVTVTVGQPSSKAVKVTAAGQAVEVPPGQESASSAVAVKLGARSKVAVTVEATDASQIVVSLRVEETGR